MLCDLGFFKDLVAVGIRASLFVYEERGTLEGELEDSYLSIIRPLYYVVLSRLSYLTGYRYLGGVLWFSLY